LIRWLGDFATAGEVWGVDISATHIHWCNRHLAPPFRFAVTTLVPTLPFPDRHFDLIYAGSVFTHVEDLADAWLLELKRLLKPGGVGFLTYHDDSTVELLRVPPHSETYLSKQLFENEEYVRTGGKYGLLCIGRDNLSQVFCSNTFIERSMARAGLEVVAAHPGILGYQTGYVVRAKGTAARPVEPLAEADEAPRYSRIGHQYSPSQFEQIAFSGVDEAEAVRLLTSLKDPSSRAEEGFVTDEYGIRTRAAHLWPGARHLAGHKLGYPVPGDFKWEVAEWLGLLRAVSTAGSTFRAMELGAGYGAGVVSAGVLARLRGITDIRLTAIEADPQHFAFLHEHFADNGFDPQEHRLKQAAIGVAESVDRWPVLDDTTANYGLRPLGEAAVDYATGQTFERTREVQVLAFVDELQAEPSWDLVHIDIQGGEFDICQSAIDELTRRVRHVVIGTHSRKIDGDLIALFFSAGWRLKNEKPAKFVFDAAATSLEGMTVLDGIQCWENPRVPGAAR
jgi:FkbM family methyltransferase